MGDLDCDICFNSFDENEHIPKILECGHTFCRTCIEKFQELRKCPNCDRFIYIQDINLYATNYTLLKTINAYKKLESSSWNIKEQVDKLKLSFVPLQERLTEYALTYNKITETVSTLDTLNPKSDIIETFHCLSNCKLTLNSAENLLKRSKNEFSINIKLGDMNSTTAFMNELVSQIKSGISFFAVHQIENEFKFGKLRFDRERNMLFMYSLSNSKVTMDDHLIWFSDLKRCIMKKNCYLTFIDVPTFSAGSNGGEKYIICLNNTALATQFLKICSGETGANYKGASCSTCFLNLSILPVLSVSDYVHHKDNETFPVDYKLGLSFPSFLYKKGDFIVRGYQSGGFELFKVEDDSMYEDIIGHVLNEHFIHWIRNEKIIDSGIGYSLEEGRLLI